MRPTALLREFAAAVSVAAPAAIAGCCAAGLAPNQPPPAAAPAPPVVIVPAVLVDYNRFEKLSPAGDLLVASVLDGLSVIDLAARGVVRARLPRCAPRDEAFAFDGRWVVAGNCAASPGAARGVVIWDLETGSVRSVAPHRGEWIEMTGGDASVQPNRPRLAAITSCPEITFVDVPSATAIRRTALSEGSCSASTSFSPDGRWFANHMNDVGIGLVASGADEPPRVVVPGAPDRWVGFSAAADGFVTRDGPRLTLRDVRSGAVRGEITPCSSASPKAVTLSPAGDVAAVTCADGAVWLVGFDRPPRRLETAATAWATAFDPSGERLAVMGDEETRVFDVAHGAELFRAPGSQHSSHAQWGRRFERVLRYVEHDRDSDEWRHATVFLSEARTGRELGRDQLVDVPRIERLGGGHVGLGVHFSNRLEASWGAEGVTPLAGKRAKLGEEMTQVDGAAILLRGVPRALPLSTGRTATIRYGGDRAWVAPLDGGREIEIDVGPGGSLELDDDDTHAAIIGRTGACAAADCVEAKIVAWPSLAPLATVKLDRAERYRFSTSPDGRLAAIDATVIDLARGAILWRAAEEGIVGFGGDGRTVILGARRETVLRDARTGAVVASFPGVPLGESTRDRRYWMTSSDDATFRALDTVARCPAVSFGDHGNRRDWPAFLEGRPFVVAFNDAGVDVVRLSDGAVLHVLFGIDEGQQQRQVEPDDDDEAPPATTSIVALTYLDDGTFDGPRSSWSLAAARTGSIRHGAVEPLARLAGRLERPGLAAAFLAAE